MRFRVDGQHTPDWKIQQETLKYVFQSEGKLLWLERKGKKGNLGRGGGTKEEIKWQICGLNWEGVDCAAIATVFEGLPWTGKQSTWHWQSIREKEISGARDTCFFHGVWGIRKKRNYLSTPNFYKSRIHIVVS